MPAVTFLISFVLHFKLSTLRISYHLCVWDWSWSLDMWYETVPQTQITTTYTDIDTMRSCATPCRHCRLERQICYCSICTLVQVYLNIYLYNLVGILFSKGLHCTFNIPERKLTKCIDWIGSMYVHIISLGPYSSNS